MRRPDAAWNYERNIDKDFFQYNKKTQEKIDVYNQSQNIIKYYYYSPKKFENELRDYWSNQMEYIMRVQNIPHSPGLWKNEKSYTPCLREFY